MKPEKLESLKKSCVHPARMAVAATLALLAARGLASPKVLNLLQDYWAPIAALIVLQSDTNASMGASWLLFVGTALGISAGTLLATFVGRGVLVFGIGILGMGLISAALRLDRRANHFACVALIIVLVAGSAGDAWHRALNRFVEFSVGIVIALLLGAVWPERTR